jgi:hypothetical protein
MATTQGEVMQYRDGAESAPAQVSLDPELERRIRILDDESQAPPKLSSRDWSWIGMTTIVLPVILLVIAWNL